MVLLIEYSAVVQCLSECNCIKAFADLLESLHFRGPTIDLVCYLTLTKNVNVLILPKLS